MAELPLVFPLSALRANQVAVVGGKNASLGELSSQLASSGVRVPDGFATTSQAYWSFLDASGLRQRILELLERKQKGRLSAAKTGLAIRQLLLHAEFPPALTKAINGAYRELAERLGVENPHVAVRSSATAEDLPEASFAGQQETFLNISGTEELLAACRRCYASLFTDRAIAYRELHHFDHLAVALSIGVQQMVRSDLAGAGVIFTLDTETGFPSVVLINASWGLGEAVVGGRVDPDEYVVFKPLLKDTHLRPLISRQVGRKQLKIIYGKGDRATRTVATTKAERAAAVLSEDEALKLARWAVAVEAHYGRPMDLEWAKDGESGELFIVQARPETVQARRKTGQLRRYRLSRKGEVLAKGLAIGSAIATGKVQNLASPAEIDRFEDGAVLVTSVTDPDWVPIMRRASAIVTDHGGRTSHAAIVSRELGVPAIVGTGDASSKLKDHQEITVSCAEGDEGFVYQGRLPFQEQELDMATVPATRTQILLNLANPAAAFRWWELPADGVGLARMEFIIGTQIKAHPMALLHFDELKDPRARAQIAALTLNYPDKPSFFVDELAYGIGRIAATRYPAPVIVRMSDFKTNEYANLIGGKSFEPEEKNPMIGWRGASRYTSEGYKEAFALECRAVRKVRDQMGLTNVIVMIPFCRSLEEADGVLLALGENGLVRGQHGLEVYVMAEIPSNVILAEEFAQRFDGFSIGSNDLTQLVLGVDRDSTLLAPLFDERNPAVTRAITELVEKAHAHGRKVGLCGQAPSDDPSFARFLVDVGIDSISVTPDSFFAVKHHVAAAESAPGFGLHSTH